MTWQAKPVPAEGPLGARLMLVGAYPGTEEIKRGRPFVGQAGRELDGYLYRHGLNRADIYITNLIKTGVGDVDEDDLDPAGPMVQAATSELLREINRVQPDVVMTLGSLPLRALGIKQPLEACHGLYHAWGDYALLPAYNPAAGLRRTGLMHAIEQDIEAAAAWNGFPPPAKYKVPIDIAADTCCYVELTEPGTVHRILDTYTSEVTAIFIDTEGSAAEPWSLQFSFDPGVAYLLRATSKPALAVFNEWLHRRRVLVVLHNALHDLAVMGAMGITVMDHGHRPGWVDTMVMAYHLCDLPQGLKSLAYRLCGMDMDEYADVVRSAQNTIARDYLEAVYMAPWPGIEPSTVWRNGKQAKTKPWQIKRHAENILANYHGVKAAELRAGGWDGATGNEAIDLAGRWGNVDEAKREIVEDRLGPMPEAGLQHIEFSRALRYACRDADALGRVYWKLVEIYKERFNAA